MARPPALRDHRMTVPDTAYEPLEPDDLDEVSTAAPRRTVPTLVPVPDDRSKPDGSGVAGPLATPQSRGPRRPPPPPGADSRRVLTALDAAMSELVALSDDTDLARFTRFVDGSADEVETPVALAPDPAATQVEASDAKTEDRPSASLPTPRPAPAPAGHTDAPARVTLGRLQATPIAAPRHRPPPAPPHLSPRSSSPPPGATGEHPARLWLAASGLVVAGWALWTVLGPGL